MAIGACSVLLLGSRAAHAQNPAAAEALFEQARAAMAAGSYELACARFRDSDKLDPAVGTRFNLADCEERRGRVATAWSLFRGVLAELSQDDDRKPIAEERAKALEPRMPYVTLLRGPETPSDARVRVDGVELTESSLGVPLPMDPGPHQLVLLSGGTEHQSEFEMQERQQLQLPLRWSSGTSTGATAPTSSAAPADAAPGRVPVAQNRRQWAYVAGGVGVAGIAFGTVTGVITLSKKSTADANCSDAKGVCNQAGIDANESGRTFGALSAVGFGLGVAGLATAAYLWLTAPPPASRAAHPSIPVRQARSLDVSSGLDWQNGGGFVALRGSF